MVKKIGRWVSISIAVAIIIFVILIVIAISIPNGKILLPVEHKPHYEHPNLKNFPTMLQSRGSRIVNREGNPIRLHGLMPSDPARLDSQELFNEEFYVHVHSTGANVIRLAVHPHYWIDDPDYLWRYIDSVVSWAGENGLYVIIDWHYIGNIATGVVNETLDISIPPEELTNEFWRLVASYFFDTPNVIFDIWNEPAGGISARTWQKKATEITELIRAQGANQLVLISGVEFARDLSWIINNPVQDENIAYAVHIYPAHSRVMWDYWFGDASQKFPVVTSEWGFIDEYRDNGSSHLVGDRASYAEPLLAYLDAHWIGWVACWYDNEWTPPMFLPDWTAPTNFGAYVIEKLQAGP